ncbi:MAG: penicillin acylase family protein [Cyclobacteriaceae bacterium]
MKHVIIAIFFTLPLQVFGQTSLNVPGLQESVEVIRDNYGVNHIYAKNEHDLFFAQGYCAAKDRLFQFEVWRRQATGTVAELLGPREINRDIGARLFRFRGNLIQELNHYHENGEAIITAYTEGVNAYISETEKNPNLLPLEFELLGTKPQKWTPDIVISRHQGLVMNLTEEISVGRMVAALGAEKVKEIQNYGPGDPVLELDPAINAERLSDDVIGLYNAFRRPVAFAPEDLVADANTNLEEYRYLVKLDEEARQSVLDEEKQIIGSNNWIVSGRYSQSGYPLLANDPHRSISAPSLRYMVHLNAPGWNVVGGGEPTIPGISIGHNDYGAWGLTVFEIDSEDLYVYELNPANKNQYKYKGGWEDMRLEKDVIKVKGAPDVNVEHKYTRHGPVTMVDEKNNIAYAVRAGWMEIGGSPYLASLRMDQAKTWEEFREACSYSHLPGENMIWADKEGNIGWQVVGVAPMRKNWSGMVPVPGDGRYEWAGFLPIKSLPNALNPEKGFLATANENLVPYKYEHRNAVGWSWAESYRADRINEVLAMNRKFSIGDMMRLQTDYLSIPARTLVPLLNELKSSDKTTETARLMLTKWDFVMDKNSVEASIYKAWEDRLKDNIKPLFVPENGMDLVRSLPLSKVIDWILTARPEFGNNSVTARDEFILKALKDATSDLSSKLGSDMRKWQYGQAKNHHVHIKHPLSNAADPATRKKIELGPYPRSGYGSTPGMTGNGDNQTHGATFRIVVDTKDWDKSMFTNSPGQSGVPGNKFYDNLFLLWANDKHFPVYFSKPLIEKSAYEKVILKP